MIGEISLEGIEFYAYHGFYPEERKIGNKYEVDVKIKTDIGNSATTDQLSETIDYGQIYNLIKTEIEIPTKLLEKIAHRIIESLLLNYPNVITVEVNVSKFNPPIGGICNRASVKLIKTR